MKRSPTSRSRPAEPKVQITADNILKASGKTFQGKEGGFIKVVGVDEKDQRLRLRLEVEQPAKVVPANPGFGGTGGDLFNPGGGPGFFGSAGGLELLDEKGTVIPCIGEDGGARFLPGGGFTANHQMTFQLQKDQKPAKLVFKGSKTVNVDIPFLLKNVSLK